MTICTEANAFAMELLMPEEWIRRDANGIDVDDEKADADQPSGSQPIANEEMKLLGLIDETLAPFQGKA